MQSQQHFNKLFEYTVYLVVNAVSPKFEAVTITVSENQPLRVSSINHTCGQLTSARDVKRYWSSEPPRAGAGLAPPRRGLPSLCHVVCVKGPHLRGNVALHFARSEIKVLPSEQQSQGCNYTNMYESYVEVKGEGNTSGEATPFARDMRRES